MPAIDHPHPSPLTPHATQSDHAARNLAVLALQQIVHRIAWIFKTETVIMPFFLDRIAGEGWMQGFLRGWLPVLNRFGQSVPPVLMADPLRRMPRKKWALAGTSLLMAVPFLTLSILWALINPERPPAWLPVVFLFLYMLFFSATGLNVLAFGTVQGKLVRPDRRGRLLAAGGITGAIASVICAWFLMQRWLAEPDGGFTRIFGFTGSGFVIAALISATLREFPDHSAGGSTRAQAMFSGAWGLVRSDRNFRRVCLAGTLFMGLLLLFPHFQALGRRRLEVRSSDLMLWVVVQNIAVGLFSFGFGWLADRRGYRLVVRLQTLVAAIIPVVALLIARTHAGRPASIYSVTFFLLGIAPVATKSFDNFVLELARPADHPRYLSTFKLFMAVPFFLSPLVGLLVDFTGFAPVFLTVTALIVAGAIVTFSITEPRHALRPPDRASG